MRRDSSIFLPATIAHWGGIEKWISGDKSAFRYTVSKYSTGFESRPSQILGWISARMARDGKYSAQQVNAILRKAADRYSGRPDATYEKNKVEDGFGPVVAQGQTQQPALPFREVAMSCWKATEHARNHLIPHTDASTRSEWPACAWNEAQKIGAFSTLERCKCGKRGTEKISLWLDEKILGFHSERFTSTQWVCFNCRMTFAKLSKALHEQAEQKRTINRIKRSIREGTKNNARTDGGAVLHHGGSNQRRDKGNGREDCTERGDSNY